MTYIQNTVYRKNMTHVFYATQAYIFSFCLLFSRQF